MPTCYLAPRAEQWLFVFSGSAQFIAILLLGTGSALGIIWLATLILNLRHLLYAATLVDYVRHLNQGWRFCLAAWLMTWHNPYLVGAVAAAAVSWRWKKLMPTILIGMAAFFLMRWAVGVVPPAGF